MPNGKKRPVDRDPTPRGKIVLFKRADGTLRGEYLQRGAQPRSPARSCHFDTCTNRRRGPAPATPQRSRSPQGQQQNAAGAFGKVVKVQVIVEYENGTVLRFQPQTLSEVLRPAGAQSRRTAG